jgi:hypothetical protein
MGGEQRFDFRAPLRLSVSTWTGEIYLRQGSAKAPLSPLPPKERREFLLELFRKWGEVAPEAAKKSAFDYADAQKGFVPVAFVTCLLFTLPMAVALLADSHQQFSCTRELRQQSVPGNMQVVKAKKRDSRTYVLNLEFTAPNGKIVRGHQEILTKDDSDLPKSYPILYSPAEPGCWSLLEEGKTDVNWARRRYFGSFSLLFGIFFLSVTLFGLAWSVARRMRPRLFAEDIRGLFGLTT